jgi:DNA-directed RNA polymerase alpha subunit
MDVGNLTISVQAYIALKQAGIETVSELLSGGRGWMGAVAESDNALVHEIKDALASLTGTDGDHGLL